MSTTTTTTTTTPEAEASVAALNTTVDDAVNALNTTVDDAVNALTAAIEAAETVVAKFGMTIVRNKAPHFILESAAESPRKRGRHPTASDCELATASAAEAIAEPATAAAVESAAIGRSLRDA